jgi:predicted nucleic acid-binding protein
MIPVDTNVISELFKLEPNAAVTLFTAAVCEAEIRYAARPRA